MVSTSASVHFTFPKRASKPTSQLHSGKTSIKGTLKSVSATEEERYTIGGTRIASPQKGINIIRMSDGTVKKVLVK